jgi:hypothetical protein
VGDSPERKQDVTVWWLLVRRVLRCFFDYYHRSRCHLSLEGDSPEPRAVHPPRLGSVVELPEVGGLHHRYVREAA